MARPALAPRLALLALAALGLVAAAPTAAQPPADPPRTVTKDPAAAPAGTYTFDLQECSVIARVPHGGGVSFSTLRFGVTRGVLDWDPVDPARIRLQATVDARPHYAPIQYRVGPESAQMLNVAKFPTATFVSTAVRRTGPIRADVEGELTLLGVTRPAVIHAELVGVTRTRSGAPGFGFTGTMQIKRSDFGMSFLPNAIGDEVTLVLDIALIKT